MTNFHTEHYRILEKIAIHIIHVLIEIIPLGKLYCPILNKIYIYSKKHNNLYKESI